MKKTDVRVKRTYKQLYDALIELLNEKSFDEITIIEICAKAEIHRATFYKHFVDKYDFLNTCFQMKLEGLNFGTLDTNYTSESMKKSCMKMINQIMDFIIENKQLLIRVKHNEYSYSFNSVLNESISDFLTQRINVLGNLSNKIGNQIPMISYYYSGALVSLIRWWIDSPENCTKEDLLKFVEINIDNLCKYFDNFID